MKRFRGGLVVKAHRIVYNSTLGSRVIKNKKVLLGRRVPHAPSLPGQRKCVREVTSFFVFCFFGLSNSPTLPLTSERVWDSLGRLVSHAPPLQHRDVILRVGWVRPLWEGYHESRRCSRDTYPESYITKYTSIRRKHTFVSRQVQWDERT